jgi:rare lipoprotein A
LPRLFQALFVLALAGAFLAFGGERASAETALASWYGPGFEGQPTASGEPYDPWGYTAAHKTLPLGTELVVSYNGLSVPVTVTDRGPYVGDRELDLSQGAATYLGLTEAGVDYVDYSYAGGGYTEPAATTDYATGYEDATGYPDAGYSDPGYTDAGYTDTYSDTSGAVQESYSVTTGDGGGYAAPETGSAGGGYVVQPGENLTAIAASLGTTVDYLASYNGITDPNFILAGQTLYY